MSGHDSDDQVDRLEALTLEYEYLRQENLRLRDGRASLTRQLGPLPIGAAVVAGLVTGFTSDVPKRDSRTASTASAAACSSSRGCSSWWSSC